MTTKTGPFKTLGRGAYATLMAVSVVAIAAGCATTQWVPVTQARPTGDGVRLRVEPPRDSASKGTRFVTLYHARMEDDSILVGTPVPADTALLIQERIPAASALVAIEHPPGAAGLVLPIVALGAIALTVFFAVIWQGPFGG